MSKHYFTELEEIGAIHIHHAAVMAYLPMFEIWRERECNTGIIRVERIGPALVFQ